MKPRSRLVKILAYAIVLFMVVSMVPINNSVHASDGTLNNFTPAGTTDDGLQWDYMNNSIIIGGYVGKSANVVIPAYISGYPVKYIGTSAFWHDTTIKTVEIPNTVQRIYELAFSTSTIEEIYLPDSVKIIGQRAFERCDNLKSVRISPNVKEIYSRAFWYCSSLTEVTIPEGVQKIGQGVFEECTSLEGIKLPDSINTLYSECFLGCKSLKYVKLPDSLKRIGGYTFKDCESLISIELPVDLEEIGDFVFQNCYNLKSVLMYDKVWAIGTGSFENCYDPMEIHYVGSEDKFNSAFKDSQFVGEGNELFIKGNKHFPDVPDGLDYVREDDHYRITDYRGKASVVKFPLILGDFLLLKLECPALVIQKQEIQQLKRLLYRIL